MIIQTAFTLYGGFWLSYAAILIPGSGILAAYAEAGSQLKSALAIYLLSWFILTFLLLCVIIFRLHPHLHLIHSFASAPSVVMLHSSCSSGSWILPSYYLPSVSQVHYSVAFGVVLHNPQVNSLVPLPFPRLVVLLVLSLPSLDTISASLRS